MKSKSQIFLFIFIFVLLFNAIQYYPILNKDSSLFSYELLKQSNESSEDDNQEEDSEDDFDSKYFKYITSNIIPVFNSSEIYIFITKRYSFYINKITTPPPRV